MSKALRYLAAARPEAATHLLSFYRHNAKAIDDKTRFLIMIVTKVTVGTERGLRQYAPKALKAGASKEEILDAVMMAFPAAGLNKVLDAINVLLDLEILPEVPSDEAQTESPSKDLGALADFPEKRMQCVNRPDGDLIVFRSGEQVKVYQSRCPHSKATLCKGIDHGTQVECRVHNWTFDLESGQCISPDPEDKPALLAVNAAVKDGRVMLD
ncbi:Rieske 2Fe-2S domain-containing protein [Magnetococcales bacterium HHB-1]